MIEIQEYFRISNIISVSILITLIIGPYTTFAELSYKPESLAEEKHWFIKLSNYDDSNDSCQTESSGESTRYSSMNSISRENLNTSSSQSSLLMESTYKDPDVQHRWGWKYFDEQLPGSNDFQVHDDSVDERVANIIYTTNRAKMVNIESFQFNSGELKLNRQYERLAAGPKFNEELCGRELGQMLALIDEMEHILGEKRQNLNNSSRKIDEKHIRLARVLDSFGRYEAGVLLGRTHFLGAYSQCIGSRMMLNEDTPETKTTARYCVARLRVDRHLDPSLKARKRRPHDMDNILNVGICVPESCHTLSFRKHNHLFKRLVESQFRLPKSIFIDVNLELDSVFCLVDKDSSLAKIPFSGKLLISFLLGWFGLVVYATYTVTTTKRDLATKVTTPSWLNSLDLKQSWEDFTKDRQLPAGRVNLDAMNPVKMICGIYVVSGHALLSRLMTTMDIPKGYTLVEIDPWLFASVGTTVVVDTFYVISGIVLAYLTMKRFSNSQIKQDKRKVGNEPARFVKLCFQFAAIRYVRLLPLYFLVFWFKKSLFTHLGSGPMWDYGLNRKTMSGACRQESWSTPFTIMSAYLPLTAQCLPHVWSVAGDLFFSIILAPIILLLVKRPKFAAILATILCVASNTAMWAKIYTIQESLLMELKEMRSHSLVLTFKEMSNLYTSPHYRVFSILVGTLAGYALYHHNHSEGLKEWPKWFRGPATKISFVYMILLLSTCPAVSTFKPWLANNFPIHHHLFEYAMTTCRLLWALANAIVLLRMVTDWKDNFWMRNSAGQFLQRMAKLNYCILLIHMDILFYDLQVQDSLGTFSRYKVMSSFSSTYFLSCMFAMVLHVCIENPIDKLTKGFIYGVNNKERPNECKNGETTSNKLPSSTHKDVENKNQRQVTTNMRA